MEPSPQDPEFERTEARLRRHTERLTLYLRVRALMGLVLILFSAAALALAVAFALTGLDLLHFKALAPWTSGFNTVLSTFMPAALAWLAGVTGWSWWRHRHPEDPDPGCPPC